MDITKRNRLTDREQTSGYQWREGRKEGQKDRELIGTKYYVQNKLLI